MSTRTRASVQAQSLSSPRTRAGHNRGRGGGQIGRHARTKRPRLEDDEDSLDDPEEQSQIQTNDNDHDEEDQDDNQEDNLIHKSRKHKKEKLVLPTFSNYHDLGLEWGQVRADEVLAGLQIPKNNRPSPLGLFEAQGLQAQYDLDKTMLSIVLRCSRHVLDEALMEGPLTREPNMYTNYQSYSVVATTTPMPPKGTSDGFPQRNKIVGNEWSTYDADARQVFSPRLFERLCIVTSEAYALTSTPLGLPSTQPAATESQSPSIGLAPLTHEEIEKYVPIFKRLVNAQKVAGDMRQGRLWRHSGKSRIKTIEKLMQGEISKVVRQLHHLHAQFNLHFHILLGCWNPGSTTTSALFQDEHTSCLRWAKLQKKTHLLETFTFEATKAPQHLCSKKKGTQSSVSGQRQAEKRGRLASELNRLIAAHLNGGYQSKADAHPKVPNVLEAMKKKVFRGGVKLAIYRKKTSNVTDEMLMKGAAPASMKDAVVDIWLKDIEKERYQIIRVDVNNSDDNKDLEEHDDDTSDDDKDLEEHDDEEE